MSGQPSREIVLGLAALEEIWDTLAAAPAERSLQLRSLLALLHARSDRTIWPYQQFWKAAVSGRAGVSADGTGRAANARGAINGIIRSLGFIPGEQKLNDAVQSVRPSEGNVGPQLDRATRELSIAMKNAKWDHEIVATKGHPSSPRARQLMAERIAQGKPVDGKG